MITLSPSWSRVNLESRKEWVDFKLFPSCKQFTLNNDEVHSYP